VSVKILLVCTGNTCRSAMAEGILKRMLKEVGETEVEVRSVGTGTAPGWEASPEAIQACKELQVDISGHRSQSVTLESVRDCDLILTMQRTHSDRILDIDPLAVDKVKLLGKFDPGAESPEIDDPVGQPLPVFRKCADRLFAALKGVVQQLPEIKKEKSARESRVWRVAIGADHRGFKMKQTLVEYLTAKRYEVADCGAYSAESADHPEQAIAVGELVRDGKVDRGILICSNGIGMTIAANKVAGVYAALVTCEADARQARQHNGANVVCFGEGGMSAKQAQRILETFLTTPTLAGEKGRYKRRRDMIRRYEEEHFEPKLEKEED